MYYLIICVINNFYYKYISFLGCKISKTYDSNHNKKSFIICLIMITIFSFDFLHSFNRNTFIIIVYSKHI